MLPSANDIIGEIRANQRFILIKDNTAGRNGIFSHHFLGYGLKNKKKVILLGLEHSLGHFHLVGVKLGYNPMKAKETGELCYIDGSSKILNSALQQDNILRPGLGLEELYNEVVDNVKNGSIVIIDNLSFLSLLGFSDRELHIFLKKILSKLVSLEGHLICTAVPLVTSTQFTNYLSRLADIEINVEDMRTGKSRDVSGHLTFQFRQENGDMKNCDYQFRVEDKTVKIFPPGTSNAVL